MNNISVDLSTIVTPKTGRKVTDFQIPEKFIASENALVVMLMQSESMNDEERQYWFNLADVMNSEQVEKLRAILTREKEKLAEIEKKYGPKQPTLSPTEIAERNAELRAKRAKQQAELAAREAAHREEQDHDSILSEWDNL